MSLKELKPAIERFLYAPRPEVLCVVGAWGAGKTHAWKWIAEQASQTPDRALRDYAYVSLFGLKSLDEVKTAILTNTVPASEMRKPPSSAQFMKTWAGSPGRRSTMAEVAKKLPLGGLQHAALALMFLDLRNITICLDDLERAAIPMSDVLGLACQLKDAHGCNVGLILNEERLEKSERTTFDAQIEKVADTLIRFEPTPEDVARIALDERYSFHDELFDRVCALRIKNIRTVQKAERHCQQALEILKDFGPPIHVQVVQTLALAVFSKFQPIDAPPMSMVKDTSSWLLKAMKEAEGKEGPEQDGLAEKRQVLAAYGFYFDRRLDAALIDGVDRGYFDVDQLLKEARAKAADIGKEEAVNSVRAAWQNVTYSFDSEAGDPVAELCATICRHLGHLRVSTLDQAITLFSELGRSDLSDQLLGAVDLFSGDFDYEYADMDDEVRSFKSSRLKELLLRRDSAQAPRPLAELLVAISKGALSDKLIQEAGQYEVAAYHDLFSNKSGNELQALIAGGLKFRQMTNPTADMRAVVERATVALQMLGSLSDLNAYRVRQFGVEIPAVPASACEASASSPS
ncbi:hypothetical protein [Chelatococcus asaccharovorans]|uniref:KAP-like P-loop domain-containing protein n=1 Tax=Chelatococcus asaccharovorans TaxID=28210 RepID=A0A2V3UAU7_9HYPH|nr:hypothetical protein [Chelatococcus asaccharovorans]MBS7703299.1 hypothetical protein [Chelatococcus asaccharovorans]PXW61633.1 hypothetical protein C7450_103150 [Chelatococcus asaccharovorans]